MNDTPYEIFVGIDWGQEENAVAVLASGRTDRFSVGLDVEAMERLVERIRAHGSAKRVAVGLERPDGLVVSYLLATGFDVFYLNPKQADRFRDRHSPAGNKDDNLDAYVLGDALRHDLEKFNRVRPVSDFLVELRATTRRHTQLGADRKRVLQRINSELVDYYPAFLAAVPALDREWVRQLWKAAPTPDKGRKVSGHVAERVMRRCYKETPEAVLSALRREFPRAAAREEAAAVRTVKQLYAQLQLIDKQMSECEAALKDVYDRLSSAAPDEPAANAELRTDVAVLRTLPGAGDKTLGVLLGEAHQALRDRNYRALRGIAGVAPTNSRTGKRKQPQAHVSMRKACNNRLRTALHQVIGGALRAGGYWREAYTALRRRRLSDGHARRILADRWLAIACAMLRSGTAYDPSKRPARPL